MRIAVIMAGGSGQRFWPLSREAHPKQLLPLIDRNTMLENAIERVKEVVPPEHVFVAANEQMKRAIAEKMPEFPLDNVIVEPMGKNTSACLALAAAAISRRFNDPTMAVLTADHRVGNLNAFHRNLELAIEIAETEKMLVTFGIPPSRPETGYGYIERGDLIRESDKGKAYHVRRFREKPNEETALQFLEAGTFFWNSGMFVWKTSELIKGFKRHSPELYKAHRGIYHALGASDEERRVSEIFEELPSISIDYAVMERASNVSMVQADFEWDDVGCWKSLLRIRRHDEYGNVVEGKALAIKTSNSVVFNRTSDKGPMVVTLGLRDHIVVVTDDVIMVCDAERDQQVKEVVQELKSRGMDEVL